METQSNHASEDTLITLANDSLDESVSHFDAATLSRLNRARQAAVAERVQSPLRRFLVPVAAAAFAGIAAVVAVPMLNVNPPIPVESQFSAAEDAELVENLDIVLWLMEPEDHAS
ncbi:MAG: DUF3619 family protein [Pseudomonadota bacterium]